MSLHASEAIKYLEHCIRHGGSKDARVHNLLLSMLCQERDEGPLLQYLTGEGNAPSGEPLYDPKFALRLCVQAKKVRCCVQLYSMMHLFEEAIMNALHLDLELAKSIADRPEDDDILRKKLWLLVARHVIDQERSDKGENIRKAIAFRKVRQAASDYESANKRERKRKRERESVGCPRTACMHACVHAPCPQMPMRVCVSSNGLLTRLPLFAKYPIPFSLLLRALYLCLCVCVLCVYVFVFVGPKREWKETDSLLKIEDILPFFPNFVLIDDFKEAIIQSLEEYNTQIEDLRTEMDEITQGTEALRRDIAAVGDRVVTIPPSECCAHCNTPIRELSLVGAGGMGGGGGGDGGGGGRNRRGRPVLLRLPLQARVSSRVPRVRAAIPGARMHHR